jgi:hypothetical protein
MKRLMAINIQMLCLPFQRKNLEIFVSSRKKNKLLCYMTFILADILEKLIKNHSTTRKSAAE